MASTSSRRRSKGKQVTYVDVDSDVDMTEDDKQIAVAKAEEKKRMSTLKVTRTDYDNRQQYSKIAGEYLELSSRTVYEVTGLASRVPLPWQTGSLDLLV